MSVPHPRPNRSIVLVGLMGVGKSTVGKRLAKRLDMEFVDSDDEIERASAMSIPEIFERFGEDSFRDGERRVIARLIEGEPKVIATGGGAFVNAETRSLVLERGIAVWLKANVEVLAERVGRRDNRPLLKGKDPVEVLRQLSEVRDPLYAEAHLHIMSEPAPHDRAVDRILEELAALDSAAKVNPPAARPPEADPAGT